MKCHIQIVRYFRKKYEICTFVAFLKILNHAPFVAIFKPPKGICGSCLYNSMSDCPIFPLFWTPWTILADFPMSLSGGLTFLSQSSAIILLGDGLSCPSVCSQSTLSVILLLLSKLVCPSIPALIHHIYSIGAIGNSSQESR